MESIRLQITLSTMLRKSLIKVTADHKSPPEHLQFRRQDKENKCNALIKFCSPFQLQTSLHKSFKS